MAHHIRIPFVVETFLPDPDVPGESVVVPVKKATVTVHDRETSLIAPVFLEESPESAELSPVETDEFGRIPGWLKEGAYNITVTGGEAPEGPIASVTYAFDAVSGRGVEKTNPEAVLLEDLLKAVQEALVPVGAIMPYGGESAPPGSLLCDGKSYTTAAYPVLHSKIGYKYGGSGANFNVPDLRGRAFIGADEGQGRVTSNNTVGKAAGTETVTLTSKQLASHIHHVASFGGSAAVSGSMSGSMSGSAGDHTHHPPGNAAGRAYMNHALPGDENASKRFLTKDTSGEVQVLWGNAGWGVETGTAVGGSPAVSVSGTVSGSSSGSITTNATDTESVTGGFGEAHNNMPPYQVGVFIIKHDYI